VETRLSTGADSYRALMVRTPDLVFVVDDEMRVVLGTLAAAHFVGRSLEEIKGARVGELFGPAGEQFERRLSEATANGRSLDFDDSLSTNDAGIWMKTSLVPLAEAAPGFVLGSGRDVTDSRHLAVALKGDADEIAYLATHDALTGIANRRAFVAALGRAVALARRGSCSTVFYMDVDHFKRVNDERGHAFGDEVLVSVACLLKEEVREVDLVARSGGDEFEALLVDSAETGAARVATRMRTKVEGLGDQIGIPIGLSIGIASVDPDASVERIMSTADRRMYELKEAGRGPGNAATA
jgi:diguanylate cyclase (GGDEF)-like protein/PAS domain S-box-containing protein